MKAGRLRLTPLFLLLAGVLLGVLFFFLADRLVGALRGETTPIVFPANASLRHTTPEFDYSVEINALGFRGRAVAAKQEGILRVVALGDSYTYGWGVDVDQSWPAVLEHLANQSGLSVEVLNLGQPDTSVDGYAQVVRRAMPILEPDLVIVSVLQADDLDQLTEMGHTFDVASTVARLFPNLARSSRLAFPTHDIEQTWRQDARQVIDRLTPGQRARFERMDERAKTLFLEGGLNPALVQAMLVDPDYYLRALDPASQGSEAAIRRMADYLRRIRSTARIGGAAVVVVSVPDGPFIDPRALANVERLGFSTDDSMLTTLAPDEAIATACQAAGVPFVTLTQMMRERLPDQPGYFEFDQHPTPAGQEAFAKELFSWLNDRGCFDREATGETGECFE